MQKFKKKNEKNKKIKVLKFIPFCLTKENCERPKIARDKHKMVLEEMKSTLVIMQLLKKELVQPTKLH